MQFGSDKKLQRRPTSPVPFAAKVEAGVPARVLDSHEIFMQDVVAIFDT